MTRLLCSALTAAAPLWLAGCASSPEGGALARVTAAGKSHFAKLGPNNVHYVVEGKGRHTIAFVHGWSCNGEFWREQVPALAAHARLLLIDLPGHGQSDKPQADYTMDFFASAVLAVMQDAHADQATLVGHSMGAPIICRVYAQAPKRVAALVAVDGLLRRPTMSPEQIERFVGPFRAPTYREHAIRFVNSMFPNPGTEALRDHIRDEMLKTPQHVMAGAMDGMFNPAQPDWDLKKVPVPVLVINAKNPMWTADYETYVRSLSPKTDYRVIEGAGHFLAQEKPAEFNAVLSELLRNFDLISQ